MTTEVWLAILGAGGLASVALNIAGSVWMLKVKAGVKAEDTDRREDNTRQKKDRTDLEEARNRERSKWTKDYEEMKANNAELVERYIKLEQAFLAKCVEVAVAQTKLAILEGRDRSEEAGEDAPS